MDDDDERGSKRARRAEDEQAAEEAELDVAVGEVGEEFDEEADRDQAPEDADDEDSKPRIVCRPRKPTREEWEAHQATHWPYRSWCPHCVAGKAIASPHRCKSVADKEFQQDRVPTISMDHCFVGEADQEGRLAGFAWLIVFDSNTEALFALPTGTKEVKEWIIVCVKSLIDQLGYGGMRVGIKNDNAPELLALRRGVIQLRDAPTTPIDVPVRESRANGACERAVRSWEGQFRTVKHHVETAL